MVDHHTVIPGTQPATPHCQSGTTRLKGSLSPLSVNPIARLRDGSPHPSVLVRGVPVSPGRATGVVRVVTDTSQFHRVRDGDVLVARITAPAWTPLFGRICAVVTDAGSVAAHASLIAREYGLPAVVATGSATTTLRDGDLITVDGSTGMVRAAPHQYSTARGGP